MFNIYYKMFTFTVCDLQLFLSKPIAIHSAIETDGAEIIKCENFANISQTFLN